MPLAPPPTIETGLGLVVQELVRNDMSRAAQVTFSLNVAGVPSIAVAQEAIDDFQGDFAAAFSTILDSDVTIVPPSIKLGDGSAVPFEAVGAGAASAGLNVSTVATPAISLLVKKTTGLGGRQNRGRTYFPFVLDNGTVGENGVIPAVSVAAYTVFTAGFLAALVADGIPMCISHKQFNVSLAPHHVIHIATGPLVTDYSVESIVATQRRRQRS